MYTFDPGTIFVLNGAAATGGEFGVLLTAAGEAAACCGVCGIVWAINADEDKHRQHTILTGWTNLRFINSPFSINWNRPQRGVRFSPLVLLSCWHAEIQRPLW